MPNNLTPAQRAMLERLAAGDWIIGTMQDISHNVSCRVWQYRWANEPHQLRFPTFHALKTRGFVRKAEPSAWLGILPGSWTITDAGREALKHGNR